ncbi:Osmotin thaumatin-like protein [Mycena haematopus]|nr:Osmotin thaumatin-like protein [Mycena haematopus]
MKSIALSLAFVSAVAAQRNFKVYNNCPFTIWPALFTSAGGRPSQTTGWAQNAYATESFSVPGNWNGRIWARRNCNFATNPGPNSCLDGGCNGGLVCDPTTGTGVPPASLAEFNLGAGGTDYYDVSLVDGYNLPVRIDNTAGCPIPKCAVDLGPNCPAALKGPFDSSGFPGSHNTPQTCPSSGVTDYNYFKSNCPTAYAYAYDDLTSLFTCASSSNAGYTVTFCPAS